MIENSPIIPSESRILGIPAFFNSPLDHNSRRLATRFLCRSSKHTFSQAFIDFERKPTCDCPCILVSDDDPFQGFFYEVLFQRTITWPKAVTARGVPKFEVFTSGEDLLKRYKQIRACGCGQTTLVVTDYNMGQNKMNGVQTIKALRSAGYKGSVILRTSEEKSYLLKRHTDLTDMLNSKIIDNYVDKTNLKEIKEIVQEFVKNVKTPTGEVKSLLI